MGVFFALNGFMFASLYGRLPEIKAELSLTDGQLAVALLGITVGLLASQALSGALVSRYGSAPITTVGASLGALLLVTPALADSLGTLVAACLAVGFTNGILDLAMNVQGVTVAKGRFSALHALFSTGVLAGSLTAAAAASLPVKAHLATVGAIALVCTVIAAPQLASGDAQPGQPAFARPTKALAALGAVAFAALLCEGAVADWSAVHLRESLDASKHVAPLALAAFSVTMITGRLLADRLQPSPRHSGATAAVGLLLGALSPHPGMAIAGFAIAGLGLSSLFPLAIRKAGSAPNIAAVSTLGYVGLVTGPPLIGAVAEVTSLPVSLAAILGSLSLMIVVLGR